MNLDNNNLKNKLREEQGLPPGFEWDKMQAGIYSNMEKMNPSATGFAKWSSALKWTGFAVAIAITAIVAFFAGSISSHKKMASQKISETQPSHIVENINQNNTTNTPSASNPVIETNDVRISDRTAQSFNNNKYNGHLSSAATHNQVATGGASTSFIPTLQTKQSQAQNIQSSTDNTTSKTSERDDIPNEDVHTIQLDNGHIGTPATVSEPILTQNNMGGQEQLNAADKSQITEVAQQNLNTDKNTAPSKEVADARKEQTVSALRPTLPFKNLVNNSKISCSLVPERQDLKKPVANKNHGLHLLAGGGVSLLSAHFTTATAQETVLSSESVVPGSLYFLLMGKKLGKNLQLQTGFEYQKLWTRFDYRLEKTYNGPITNQVVEIHINAITGDSTFIYADTMLSIKETRTIRHYNRLQVISIPLMAEYEKRVGKWSLLASAGVAAHFRQSASGRTLLGNDIVAYDNNQPIHTSFLGLSIRSQLGMIWHFNERVGIQASIAGAKTINNWSSAIGTTYQPWLLSFGTGLRYKF